MNIKFKNLLSNPSIDSRAAKVFGIKFLTICLKTCSLHRYSPARVDSLLMDSELGVVEIEGEKLREVIKEKVTLLHAKRGMKGERKG
jgi:hypothetical protein